MELIEHKISNLVENQFPQFYQESGPVFIEFVKKYYEWLEQQNETNYHARRIFEYTDIDETVDDFLVYFKETYLKNIKIDTMSNTRMLLKHSLDLYRSKGSERALKLIFRAVFGVNCKIYYPDTDVFRLSAGKYQEPQYIEVTLSEENAKFVGYQIIGITSKAVAFVERVIRKTGSNKIVDIFYISAIRGTFKVGERVDFSNKLKRNAVSPTIVGSLGNVLIDVAGSGADFSKGDIVDIYSETGMQAKGRVSNTISSIGALDFILIEGGYGYSNSAKMLISDKVMIVSNTTHPNLQEGIYQPLANLHYINANNSFAIGDYINTYHANNSLKGTGEVIKVYQDNSSSGYLFIQILTGNVNSDTIYSSGNLVVANLSVLDGYTDLTATGNIVGSKDYGSQLKIGVANVVNQFYINCYAYTTDSMITNMISSVSFGAGANIGFYSNSLLYTEDIILNTDLLKDYEIVRLNANTYGFPGDPSANISSLLSDALTETQFTFGKIQTLIGKNPGHDYSDKPFVTFVDYYTLSYRRLNQYLHYSNATGLFSQGEIIVQESSNGRAMIMSSNSSVLTVQPLRIRDQNQFVANDELISSNTGATAFIDYIDVDNSSVPMGMNANIDIKLTTSSGAIKSIDVIDSGFSFKNNQEVTIVSNNNIAVGISDLKGVGKSRGYYREIGGTLSGRKRLYDGYYYQEYSYDVISSINLEKYSDILKNVVHTAGTKFFGTLKKDTRINTNKDKLSRKIIVS